MGDCRPRNGATVGQDRLRELAGFLSGDPDTSAHTVAPYVDAMLHGAPKHSGTSPATIRAIRQAVFRAGGTRPRFDRVTDLDDDDVQALLKSLIAEVARGKRSRHNLAAAAARIHGVLDQIGDRAQFRAVTPALHRLLEQVAPHYTMAGAEPAAAGAEPHRPTGARPSSARAKPNRPAKAGAELAGADAAAPATTDMDAGGSSAARPRATRRRSKAATRTAYARLDAPATVAPQQEFDLVVGLAAEPSAAVSADPMTVPSAPFTLRIALATPGFERISPKSAPIALRVTEAEPFPSATVRLIAMADDSLRGDRIVQATYFAGNRMLGQAAVLIRVGTASAAPSPVDPPAPPDPAWPLPSGRSPDLTILLAADNSEEDRFLWDYASPHRAVGNSTESTVGNLPDRDAFTAEFRTKMEDSTLPDPTVLRAKLAGLAGRVADAVPEPIWTAIRAAATAATPKAPTILLVSADAYLPWELAAVADPWLPADAPLLGAQAAVGRWTTGLSADRLRPSTGAGRPERPPARSTIGRHPAPPQNFPAATMDVVSGDYEQGALAGANAESAYLNSTYGATRTDATAANILRCLTAEPTPNILHFAVHGEIDEMGMADGLIMPDGSHVDADTIAGAYAGGKPREPVQLAFLNACQVGQGREILGAAAGIPAALLRLGIGAVVAARWRVSDAVALTAAEGFYAAVFGADAVAPAEQLRRALSAAWSSDDAAQLRSHSGYLFFGHPALSISWKGKRDAVPTPR